MTHRLVAVCGEEAHVARSGDINHVGTTGMTPQFPYRCTAVKSTCEEQEHGARTLFRKSDQLILGTEAQRSVQPLQDPPTETYRDLRRL